MSLQPSIGTLLTASLLWMLAGLLAAPIPAYSQSVFDTDDDSIDIFDTQEPSVEELNKEIASDPISTILGSSTFTWGYRFSYATARDPEIVSNFGYLRVVSEMLLGGSTFFRLDGKTSLIPSTDHRADSKQRDLYLDPRLRELYLQKGAGDLSVRLGWQMVAWGKADTVAITDVVSPRDLSDFVFTDLEDARFGQFLLSAAIYGDAVSGFLFLAPRPETDRAPETGDRYDRTASMRDAFAVRREEPEFGDLEYGARWDLNLAKTELSFMAGRFFINSPVYRFSGDFLGARPVLAQSFPDYGMVGIAATHARQSVLLKLEAAFKDGLPLQGIGEYALPTSIETAVLDAAVGVEYNANDRYQMTLEVSNRHLFGDLGPLGQTDRDRAALYYTFAKDFLNQTLAFEYVLYCSLDDRDLIHDAQFTYDLSDHVQVTAAFTHFDIRNDDSLLWPYRREDRVTLGVERYF